VDTNGLLLAVVVHSAGIQDREGACLLLSGLVNPAYLPRLSLIWADGGYSGGGYAGKLVEWVCRRRDGLTLEIVKRSAPQEGQEGFVVLPRRWVVERTFAWLLRWRRLHRDVEKLPESSQAWIYIAMTKLMLQRLAKTIT
jgi:putative transposase